MVDSGRRSGLRGFLVDYLCAVASLAATIAWAVYALTLAPWVYQRFEQLGEGWAIGIASAPVWLPLLAIDALGLTRMRSLARRGLERRR